MSEVSEVLPSVGDVQRTVLDSIALGESLSDTLNKACSLIEHTLGDAICCVMLLDKHANTLNIVAGPSLSQEVIEGLNGLVPGPHAASCGTAAFTGKPVIVEDTTVSPHWADFQEAVNQFGIGSCWSYPILAVGGGGETLGTFAICHGHAATPESNELQFLETASQLAGIAVQRMEADQTIRHTQDALVEIARDVSGEVGRGFLCALALRLTAALDTDFAMVSERIDFKTNQARSIGFAGDGKILENMEYDLAVTPCSLTVARDLYYCPRDLCKQFPDDEIAIELGIEGYMGLTLKNGAGQTLGWLAVFSRTPIARTASFEAVLRSFAVRAAAELERARVESDLRNSENRYRSLYNSTPVMMHSIDRNGHMVSVNEHWLKTLGYERDEVIGRLSVDFHTAASRKIAYTQWLPQLFAGEPCVDLPFELIAKDGRVVHVQLTATLETGTTLADTRGHVIMRDVTERYEHEVEVDRLNTALDNALQGIAKLDTNGIYVMIRPAYAITLGYEVDELIGQSWELTVPAEKRIITQKAAEQMIKNGSAEVENTGIRKDGTLFYKHCLLVRSIDSRGEYDGFYCFMKDITERVNAEQNRKGLESQLRQSQKLEAVGTLASGVAHDINNTLTAVFGFAEQAKRQLDSPAALERSIDMIERAAEQAANVTRSLLTFAQRTATEKGPIRLDLLVTESMQLLHRLLPASIELVQEIDATTPIWIDADHNQIQQVLMNLTINARHAMNSRGTLRVGLHINDDRAVLTVEDNGTGMSQEVQQRIFEPFYTTKERGQGTGLGLSVVHGIISDHGGNIDVHSVEGEGTRFEIRFPLAACNQASDTPSSADVTANNSPTESTRILIAEDDEYVGAAMTSTLESEGFDVTLVRTGDEAMRAFNEQPDQADVVILDFDLPGQTGEACRRHIQNQRADLPVIIVTGNTGAYLETRATDTEMNRDTDTRSEQILAKPFKMNQLLDEVLTVLNRNG